MKSVVLRALVASLVALNLEPSWFFGIVSKDNYEKKAASSAALLLVEAAGGLIWSNASQEFRPIFDLATFREARERRWRWHRRLEFHNFHGAELKLVYFEEGNLVKYIDNDTRVTGVCGELWNNLADYLNFTLVPVKMEQRNFGGQRDNGSYDGILGRLQANDSQIVPRSGMFRGRLDLLEYTVPLWSIRYRLYIRPEWRHDEAWMIHLFSPGLWSAFFLLLLGLGCAEYLSELCSRHDAGETDRDRFASLQDHVFYTVAVATSQGGVPAGLHDKSRLVYLSTSLFAWVVLIAFSSHAILLLTSRRFVPPFADLRGLLRGSQYAVLAFNGSMVHQEFRGLVQRYARSARDFSRVSYAPAAQDMYAKACAAAASSSSKRKKRYAVFEADDRHKALGRDFCRLVPTGAHYFESFVASAVKRGFKYKRCFDLGIVRMLETGLLDGLRERWLDNVWSGGDDEQPPFQSIDMQQVYVTFGVLAAGASLSILVLLAEILCHFLLAGHLKPPSEDRREEGNGSSSRWNVRPNLNGTKIHAVYFQVRVYDEKQDPDYFEFQRGKRSATGICGDVWSVLADLLNFTLVVTRSRTRSLGTVVQPANRSSSSSSSNNDKNFTDLLGLVQQGRYEAIPKMEAFAERLAAVDFTRSIWKDRYRLFVRPYYRFKSLWMLDLFSWQVWAAAGLFYLLLVAVNVAASRWSSSDDVAPRVVLACSSSADYLFYGFGALCNQGEPLYLALWESSSRLLALSTGLFSWLLLVSYGSQLVIFMQRTYSPAPFSSLDQLLDETDYAILAERHSIVEIGFRKNYRPVYARIQLAERIAFLDTHQDMWSLACSQSEYARMAELAPCELVPVPGESYFKTWIVAGLAKGCRHKRAIDSG
ncbi:uncharacterized protein LOC106655802 [Trichogramma pretiosum]|uniref:uncharacterized protein LOC106655802 n=1 Tax=Trichogramma pretiosum TaxID=7493 RepID=UPI0006C984B6|nr:uncharacterized protein LOC106655802 [Trichogramma pretiosum]